MRFLVAVMLVCLMAVSASAYDQFVVHTRMTSDAFGRALARDSFLSRIGFSDGRLNRTPVVDIVANGATAEDDGQRPLNHFYDPLSESPLFFVNGDYVCLAEGVKKGEFNARLWATSAPSNQFGLAAAKQQLIEMIVSSSQSERDKDAYDLFTSLGHMMHLVQDMAQPQHTRNDAHPTSENVQCTVDIEKCRLDDLNLWSRYEAWCAENLNVRTKPAAAGFYSGYPVVSLPSYAVYFNSGNDRGLAEYSNMNFVTEHTNYSDRQCAPFFFTSPQLPRDVREEERTVNVKRYSIDGSSYSTSTTYSNLVYTFPTYDAYTQTTAENPYHTLYSYFDYELLKERYQQVYSLSSSAFESQASLLVRRAVGYSAGFLAHFFRGKIDAQWQKNSSGTWDVTITNKSAEKIGADARLKATFRATKEYFRQGGVDSAWIVDAPLSQAISGFSGIAPGQSVTIRNLTSADLHPGDELTSFERRLVVIGSLGSEPQAVLPLVQLGQKILRAEITTSRPGTVGFAFTGPIGWYYPTTVEELYPLKSSYTIETIPSDDGIYKLIFAFNPPTASGATTCNVRVWYGDKIVEDRSFTLDAFDNGQMGSYVADGYSGSVVGPPGAATCIEHRDGCKLVSGQWTNCASRWWEFCQ